MRSAELWELVKDLEPLTEAEMVHFTKCADRRGMGPKGWVREYVPRMVRTLMVDPALDSGYATKLREGLAFSITGDVKFEGLDT